jgi:hypothetical protein
MASVQIVQSPGGLEAAETARGYQLGESMPVNPLGRTRSVGLAIAFDTFATLSDSDLLAAVHAAARRERATTAELVALLVHVDSRRLYLAQGCSSLFTYCTQVLHLSEHAAYGRIVGARAARRCPVIFRSGSARSLAQLPTCD